MDLLSSGGITLQDLNKFLFGDDYGSVSETAGNGINLLAATNLSSVWGESD
jgi:hypothetical protein